MSRGSDSRMIRVLQFLDAYERQESLWNPALESYKNKLARDEAYMHIIKDLNNPSLSIHDIKLKVKSIRTTYTKELRLVTKNKELGKAYTPKLFWFNRANAFLKNVSLSRDKRSISLRHSAISDEKPFGIDCVSNGHLVNSEEGDEISNAVEDTAITSSCTYEYKILQTKPIENPDDDFVESRISEGRTAVDEQMSRSQPNTIEAKFCTTPISDVSNNNYSSKTIQNISRHSNEDEYDFFCRSVAVQLRSINDTYSRSVAKLKIQQILFEAETGHYRNSPCITIPVNQPVSSV